MAMLPQVFLMSIFEVGIFDTTEITAQIHATGGLELKWRDH